MRNQPFFKAGFSCSYLPTTTEKNPTGYKGSWPEYTLLRGGKPRLGERLLW